MKLSQSLLVVLLTVLNLPPPPTLQDELLKAAVNLYGTSGRGVWVKIAEYVGHGVNNKQCQQRWTCSLDPQLQLKHKTGPWLEEEVCDL